MDSKTQSTALRKILVVRLSSIGDIILTTPLLRSLKNTFPDSHITFLVKKQYKELLIHSPYIDELVSFDQTKGFAGLKKIRDQLRSEKFDLYIDIHRSLRSIYLRFGIGAKKVTSYRKLIVKRTVLIRLRWNLYRRIRPVYKRYFDSVKAWGIQYDGLGTEIRIPESTMQKVREMLSAAGYSSGTPLVVVCPSATYFNKKWKPEGFIETLQYIIHEKSAFIIVHGGKDDRKLCDMISSGVGEAAVSMAGMLSLLESAALLKLATLVIANDSGLLHMAQSQKTPVVGIYGATTRELGFFPIEQDSTVVETRLSCRPCTHKGLNHCPKGHFRCMNDISADMVIKAASQYL